MKKKILVSIEIEVKEKVDAIMEKNAQKFSLLVELLLRNYINQSKGGE